MPPQRSESRSPIPTTVSTAVAVPDLAAQGSEPLRPGPYAITSISPLRITFTVPADWSTYGDVPATVWVRPGGPSSVGPLGDDLAQAVARAPGLVHNATTDLMLSGFTGKLAEITCSTEPGLQSDSNLYILDVDGTRLVI